jgi:hypothetical protein
MKCLVCCPVLGGPDDSLPARAHGVARYLRSSSGDDIPALDGPRPRESAPEYVRRLLAVSPHERRAVVEQLRDEVGPIGTLVVIREIRE